MPARRTRTTVVLVVGALLAAPLAATAPAHAADPVPVPLVPPEGVVLGGALPSGLDLSADGRWIVYNGQVGTTYGLYATERTTGRTTTLRTGSTPFGDLSVSADGNRVAYVLGDPGFGYELDAQVRLLDRTTGADTLVSATPGGVAGNAASGAPQLSEDGSVVAFETRSTNLADGTDGEDLDVLVKVLATGAVERVGGTEGSSSPSVSADGDRVAFKTDEQLAPGDDDTLEDVVVRTRSTGGLVLASAGIAADGFASHPTITADGRKVAYLVPEGGRPEVIVSGVFVTDLATGDTVRASTGPVELMRTPGVPAEVSADGRFVLFTAVSSAAGLGDRAVEAYLRDLERGTTQLVSTVHPTDSFAGGGAAISADGRIALYTALSSGRSTYYSVDLTGHDPDPQPEPEPEPVPDPVNVTPPSVESVRAESGPSYAFQARNGVWAGGPSGATQSYQWLRDGTPIAGETSRTYTAKASDFGKRIAVRESLVASGKVLASVDSDAVTARKATSTVSARVAGRAGRNAVVLRIRVTHEPDVRPQGKVLVVWAGGVRLVDVGPDGRAKVTVRTWWPGRHSVGLAHLPTAYVKAAPMRTVAVKVRR